MPGRVEPGDDGLELLVERRILKLVAAVREHHHQSPDGAALLRDGIGPHAHLAEVDLPILSWRRVVESFGELLLLTPSQLALDELSEGRIADLDAAPLQQRLDPAERQRLLVVGELTVDHGFVL
ncbi:MAG: hypothetical protein AAF851_09305 [Myxococcota bacterium]